MIVNIKVSRYLKTLVHAPRSKDHCCHKITTNIETHEKSCVVAPKSHKKQSVRAPNESAASWRQKRAVMEFVPELGGWQKSRAPPLHPGVPLAANRNLASADPETRGLPPNYPPRIDKWRERALRATSQNLSFGTVSADGGGMGIVFVVIRRAPALGVVFVRV